MKIRMREKGKMERPCPLAFSFSHVRSRTPQLFVLQNEISFSRLEDFRRVVMHPTRPITVMLNSPIANLRSFNYANPWLFTILMPRTENVMLKCSRAMPCILVEPPFPGFRSIPVDPIKTSGAAIQGFDKPQT